MKEEVKTYKYVLVYDVPLFVHPKMLEDAKRNKLDFVKEITEEEYLKKVDPK